MEHASAGTSRHVDRDCVRDVETRVSREVGVDRQAAGVDQQTAPREQGVLGELNDRILARTAGVHGEVHHGFSHVDTATVVSDAIQHEVEEVDRGRIHGRHE